MKRILMGLALVAGFVVLQLGEAKADHWDRNSHDHGRSSLPAYRRELQHARTHQVPMTSSHQYQMHNSTSHGISGLQNRGLYSNYGTGYSNRGSSFNSIYSSPSMGCDSDRNYNSNLRSRSIYQGGSYSW